MDVTFEKDHQKHSFSTENPETLALILKTLDQKRELYKVKIVLEDPNRVLAQYKVLTKLDIDEDLIKYEPTI